MPNSEQDEHTSEDARVRKIRCAMFPRFQRAPAGEYCIEPSLASSVGKRFPCPSRGRWSQVDRVGWETARCRILLDDSFERVGAGIPLAEDLDQRGSHIALDPSCWRNGGQDRFDVHAIHDIVAISPETTRNSSATIAQAAGPDE
jgi:hypothetical protein